MITSEVVVATHCILVPSVVSGVAIYYARKSARIAEEQAAQHPAIEVVQVDREISESIREQILLVEQARRSKEREAEEEEPSSQIERLARDITLWSASGTSLEERAAEEYEGELPDTALSILLVNRAAQPPPRSRDGSAVTLRS